MKRLRLITDLILEAFAHSVFVNRDRLYRIWIVAPWIGYEESKADPILYLIEALRNRECPVVVITRPSKEAWHLRAIQLLRANVKTNVFLCTSLHTKLYIMECDGFRSAMLGSPNLTPRANVANREIAVEFRTTVETTKDDIAAIIAELINYASGLRNVSKLDFN